MASEPTNFFSDDDVEEPEMESAAEAQEEQPSTFKVGEEEYSQEDLESLVGLGKMAREAEEKYNTPMDRVYPEYTKSRQELKELKSQIETQVQTGDMSPDQAREALKAAEGIGLVTKDNIGNLIGDHVRQIYAEQRAADNLLDNTDKLASEIDGSDGRPKFDQKAILEYMRDTGITDPTKAYKIKYEREIDTWKEQQLKGSGSRVQTLDSSTAGSKSPAPVAITNDNIDELMREALR